MKKPIKIVDSNAQQIEAALKEANGDSVAHTYTKFIEIKDLADKAEKELSKLLYKKNFSGAQYEAESGDAVARAYKYKRKGTFVQLQRKSESWFLVSVCSVDLYENAGKHFLCLTQQQDAAAKEKIAENYHVIKSKTVETQTF